ncbi:MAG: HEAT repeat domain-containing protein [Sedimentisphaerales bacterium]|nr:HEAT repeat domain-containing protein [Sedimentisphaerales bacterium]
MKDEFTGFKAHRHAQARYACRLLLVALFSVFFVGCEVPQQPMTAPQAEELPPEADVSNDLTAQAYRVLLSGLTDENPMIRANAIEVVAETGQVKLVPKIQRLLGDEFAPVRFAAALAIGDLEYSFGSSLVRQLFKDPDSNVKIAACYAMVRLGSKKYQEVLRRAIASTDQTVRANAAFLLGKSHDKDALKLLYWAMRDHDSQDKVIYQAAESIAMVGDERIYPKLWTMLLSVYADVRVTGIKCMGALGTRDAKNALLSMLDDKVVEVRLAAAEQLGRFNDTSGEAEVLDVFRKKLTAGMDAAGCERVYVLTALAIGRIGTPELTAFLPRLLENESKAVRIAAAKAVLQGKIPNPTR